MAAPPALQALSCLDKQLLCDRSHRLVPRVLVCDCCDTTAILIPQGQSCLSMPGREAKSTMAVTFLARKGPYFASGVQEAAHCILECPGRPLGHPRGNWRSLGGFPGELEGTWWP